MALFSKHRFEHLTAYVDCCLCVCVMVAVSSCANRTLLEIHVLHVP